MIIFILQEYSCDLEDSATEWASQCNHSYSPASINKGAGEFIQLMSISSQTIPQVFVSSFFYKVINKIVTTGLAADGTLSTTSGDWAQIGAAGTYLVGCSTQTCGSSAMTTCHYKKK